MDLPEEPKNENDIDFENQFSRLISAVGKETLLSMQNTRILLMGVKGLGVEIAKNLLLIGVKSLCLVDDTPVSIADLSSNFYLSSSDLGKSRADACLLPLRELNDHALVKVVGDDVFDGDGVNNFDIVVLTENQSRKRAIEINQLCRKSGVGFILADTRGLFGTIFVDFGPSFTTLDPVGRGPLTRFLEGISNEENPLVHLIYDEPHELEIGDVIRFSEVEGMTEINGKEAKITSVVSSHSIKINLDTSNFSSYSNWGRITQVKQPKTLEFSGLKESWEIYQDDKTHTMDLLKEITIKPLYHLYYQALLSFQESHNGELPRSYHPEDANELLCLVEEFNQQSHEKIDEIDTDFVKQLSFVARGDLSPMASVIGGIVGFEVVKYAGKKFTPLNQWLYFDSLACLNKDVLPSLEEVQPTHTRFDGQIAVFGKPFVERLRKLRYFLVGAGALGSEILKNWALMGIGSLEDGAIHVADMDSIKISTLSQQLLYRHGDLGKQKSEVAAQALKKMNEQINVVAHTQKVISDTENIFDFKFWGSLDGVQSALDNVNGRLYVDTKCVFHLKSYLQAETLGPKGNVQVVVPNLTESYSSGDHSNSGIFPSHKHFSFPSSIKHCLMWGQNLFDDFFISDPKITNEFLEEENLVPHIPTREAFYKTLERTVLSYPRSFEECVFWAHSIFEEYYFQKISQILFHFPEDKVDSSGNKFWTGAKRIPTPIHFDPYNQVHLDFITAASFLRAYVFGLINSEMKPENLKEKREEIQKISSRFEQKEFENNVDGGDQYVEEMNQKLEAITPQAKKSLSRMNVIEFEKDNVRNFHIDFIQAAANLQAFSYKIDSVDYLQAKLFAGRIQPTVVTTTTLVAGLSSLELYKLAHSETLSLESFSNSFVDLATSSHYQSEPQTPQKQDYKGQQFTLWDRIEIHKGDLVLKKLVDLIEDQEDIEVELIGIGSTLVYFTWMSPEKRRERMGKKLSVLLESKSGKKMKSPVLVASISGTYEGEDLEYIPEFHIYL